MKNTVLRSFFLYTLTGTALLLEMGCRTACSPVVIKDRSQWDETRAIAVINAAFGAREAYKPFLTGDPVTLKELEHNADENGLTGLRVISVTSSGNRPTTRYLPVHVPYSEIAKVEVEKITIGPIGLLLCGLVSPLYWQTYFINVKTDKAAMPSYKVAPGFWFLFPFWLVRPFYFFSEEREIDAYTLAEAFVYMKQKEVPNPK